jgi:hypothetical protein
MSNSVLDAAQSEIGALMCSSNVDSSHHLLRSLRVIISASPLLPSLHWRLQASCTLYHV